MSDNDDKDWVTINGKRYPSKYPPGTHWSTNEAWSILDTIKDGVIPDDVRCFLAGLISGTLCKERSNCDNKLTQIITTCNQELTNHTYHKGWGIKEWLEHIQAMALGNLNKVDSINNREDK